jgi:exonuclease SbcD
MKILHTADWHLGRKLEGHSRHSEQVQVLDDLCQIADDEAVQAIIIAGDIYDSYNPPAEAEALYYQTVVRLADSGRRAVVVIAGNHDSPERLLASNPYARGLGIVTLGYPSDIPRPFDNGSERVASVQTAPSFVRLRLPKCNRILSVLALPYPSETRLREVLSEITTADDIAAIDYSRRIASFMNQRSQLLSEGDASIIASHLYVTGGDESESERRIQVGGTYAVQASCFPPEADYVALGHLHRPQEMFGLSDLPIRYSGSILQYSFSEAEQQKEVTIITYEGTKATYYSVPLNAGHQLRKITAHNLEHLEQQLESVPTTDWLSINVAVDEPLSLEYMANLRKEHAGIIHCIPTYRQIQNTETNRRKVSELTLAEQFERFVNERYDEPCNEEILNLFLQLAERDLETS